MAVRNQKSRIDVAFTVGANVSPKSTPCFWVNPLAHSLDLYQPSSFLLKIIRDFITLIFDPCLSLDYFENFAISHISEFFHDTLFPLLDSAWSVVFRNSRHVCASSSVAMKISDIPINTSIALHEFHDVCLRSTDIVRNGGNS